MLDNKKGQSTVEYVLLATAVIAIIVGLTVSDSSPFRTKLNQVLNDQIGGMEDMSSKLYNSH